MKRAKTLSGLFVCEGGSDLPLADLVTGLLLDRGVDVRLTAPDLSLIRGGVGHAVEDKVQASLRLYEGTPDIVVVHRDADSLDASPRVREVDAAFHLSPASAFVPIVPVHMTEAWLLLDEAAIRRVAGNPRGQKELGLPPAHQVEALNNPKEALANALLLAADASGRRHAQAKKRFPAHRKQLLERLDRKGPVGTLNSYKALVRSIDEVVNRLV